MLANLRQAGEPDLRATASRVEAFLENTSDCVMAFDSGWRITYLNRRARSEVAAEDLIGADLWSAYPELREHPIGECYRQVMEDQIPQQLESFYEPLGSWYDIKVAPVEDGLVVCFHNIDERKEREARLAERERQLASVVNQSIIGIQHSRIDGSLLMVNERFCTILGRSREEIATMSFREYTHPDDLSWNEPLFEAHRATGEPFQVEKRYIRPDGSIVWCIVRVTFVKNEAGQIESMIAFTDDITARKTAEAELRDAETLSTSIVEASTDCIKLLDLDGHLLFMNKHGHEVFELDHIGQNYGLSWLDVWPEDMRPVAKRALDAAKSGQVGRFSGRCPTAKGTVKWWDNVISPVLDIDGSPIKLLCISRDVTQQRLSDEQVRWSATHDALTSLPNRTAFQERLGKAIRHAEASGTGVGLLHLDVDHFKQINDSVGHDAGDSVLKNFADRLRSVLRNGDCIARLGGDEFAVVLPGLSSDQEVQSVAEAILDRLREPYVYSGRVLDCRASIGASIYPEHGGSPEELLKSSDVALYSAKAAGRGVIRIFKAEMRAEIQLRRSMVEIARDAARQDRVVPFYQPKIDLRTGRVAGFEALLRWRNMRGGYQLPGMISAAFEDLDVACLLSEQMVRKCIGDMRSWLDRGIDFGHVALNAAAAEFRSDNFGERVLEELRRADIPFHMFQLEVTEHVFLGRGAENVERALKLLSANGVRIALDDFGTGYASLRHLKQFPVDVIKIDRSFVSQAEANADDASIIMAVLRLGQSLGIETVAEGIETQGQASWLASVGCDLGQGHLFAKAMSAAHVPAILRHLHRSDRHAHAA